MKLGKHDPDDGSAIDPKTGLNRRQLLFLGAVVAAVGAGALTPAPAFAAGLPTTAQGCISLARSYLGRSYADLHGLDGQAYGGWASYPATAAWCAWFASWCLRGLGTGFESWADEMNTDRWGPSVSSPRAGDVVVWPRSHVGIVTEVVGGTVYFIDGNGRSTDPGYPGVSRIPYRRVAERRIYGSPVYRRPPYSATEAATPSEPVPPVQAEGSDMPIVIRDPSNSRTYTVAPGLYIRHHEDAFQRDTAIAMFGPMYSPGSAGFRHAFRDLGFANVYGDPTSLPTNGETKWADHIEAAKWIKNRVGGTWDGASLTEMIRNLA